MKRKKIPTLLAVIFLLSLYLVPLGQTFGVARHDGDYWEYEAEESRNGLTLEGTIRAESVGKERITVAGTEYETTVLSWSGEGTYTGMPMGMEMSGNWTISGFQYFQESNDVLIKSIEHYILEGTYSFPGTSGDWSYNYHNETLSNLLMDEKSSEMDVGSLGYTVANVTSQVTLLQGMDGNIIDSLINHTFEETIFYNCTKKETIIVPAGKFETYQIKITKPDGSYKLDWRSPEVGHSVKMEIYDNNGVKQGSMELKEYYQEQESTSNTLFGMSPSTFLVIASLIIVVVIILIFLLVVRRKR
jgi:hypothetical protein